MRVRYRIKQFWHAVTAAPSKDDLGKVNEVLSPQLMSLFRKMQASEQAHSLHIYQQLRDNGETNADLMVAALLHDVGKSRYPLRIWERGLIVMGNKISPQQAQRWGEGQPTGWKRAFVIAEKHAAWGAEMVAEAGASPMTAKIIQRHQETLPIQTKQETTSLEDRLIQRLQLLDNNS
jgi:putative nucleotidyltransferase with HDIG domain